MAPVQARAGLELDWGAWSVAPRVYIVSSQRLMATENVGSSMVRRTLDGYLTGAINIRREGLFKHATAFLSIDNVFDARYRNVNARAYNNPEELIGEPQNPRRLVVGLEFEVGKR